MKQPRILIPLFDYVQDLGGIINWAEHLIWGFKQLGCDVNLVRLERKSVCNVTSGAKRKRVVGHAGYPLDQKTGWMFPKQARIPLFSTDWVKFTKDYDLIIWMVPVPTKTGLFDGWQDLYKPHNNCTQVMMIHDGNLNSLYTHAYDVINKVDAVVGVHDCAVGTINASPYKGKALLIPNPQIKRFQPINFEARKQQALSLQTWKHWKHVGDIIRAIPYMKHKMIMGGAGIHYYWMSGKIRRQGYETIWEEALEGGMQYVGWITEPERDAILCKSKLLIDPSWSKRYAQYGSHFNRVFCDAAICGCLPVGRDLLMDNNRFFDPEDYITIPYNAPPKEFAEATNKAIKIQKPEYTHRIKNLQAVVDKHFDALKVARQFLKL